MTIRSPFQTELSRPLRIRPLSQYDAAALGVDTQAPSAARALKSGIKGRAPTGEVNAPAYEVSQTFIYQSYFDDDLAERAILPQPANQPIVPSTKNEKPIATAGYGVALHPSSETPVAIQFDTGGQQGRSATYRLKPGEVLYPFGRPDGKGHNGQFSSFSWGLPFGWLGGGSANLIILRTADARVNWPSDHNEIVYHRIRLLIQPDVAALNALATANFYNGPLNWPQRFPWPAARSGLNTLSQRGQPALAVTPTRTAMALQDTGASFPTPSTMRAFFIGADVWAQQADGSIDLSNAKFTDVTWGTFTLAAGIVAPFSGAQETQIVTGELERIACNAGAVVLAPADFTADIQLVGKHVDFVRYGRL